MKLYGRHLRAMGCLPALLVGLWLPKNLEAEVTNAQAQEIISTAPANASLEPAEPRRVLIFSTPAHLMPDDPHKGYCIPYGREAFRAVGRKTGAYKAVVSDDLANFLPENINRFDAIVLNNTSGAWITPTEADLKRDVLRRHGDDKEAVEKVLRQSLLDYVAGGGGLMGIHYAIGGNRHWPAFHELLGARYNGHPWNEEVGVKVDSPNHTLVDAFDDDGFRIADEIFQFREPYSRQRLRVLLSLDTTRTNMDVKWIHREDGDFALAWVKRHGEGRVFYTALGHRTEIYFDPRMLEFYLDGVQFVTGDLPGPIAPSAIARPRDSDGFKTIFDGKTLEGWSGDRRIWSARNGAITGETTDERRVKENNFLIWQGGRPGDFELRCQFKLVGGNTGIYFHGEKRKPGTEDEPLVGPQADFSADHRWTGVLMEYTKRGILAERGQQVWIDRDGTKHTIGSVGDPDELLEVINDEDWNDYTLIARDGWVVLRINGVTMCEVIDEDPARTPKGHLAFQVHTGPPMTVQFRDVRLKRY